MSPNLVTLLLMVAALGYTVWTIRKSRLVRDAPVVLADTDAGASADSIEAIDYYWRPG